MRSLTLFSPSMTMTGTEVAGQRCLAGRGLSQFHRTTIWRKEERLEETGDIRQWSQFGFLQPKLAAPHWTCDASVTCSEASVTLLQSEYYRAGGVGTVIVVGTIQPIINHVTLSGFIFSYHMLVDTVHRVDDLPSICWCFPAGVHRAICDPGYPT